MENHNFYWENLLSMAIFNSYVKLPEGTHDMHNMDLSENWLPELLKIKHWFSSMLNVPSCQKKLLLTSVRMIPRALDYIIVHPCNPQ